MAAAPYHIRTISEYHRLAGLPGPEHPLISVMRFEDIKMSGNAMPASISHYFYSIAVKSNFKAKMKYGQHDFDFDGGVLHFMSPKQVLSYQPSETGSTGHTGWLLLIHPDFLAHSPLARKIKQYEYFGYQVHEALHLSDKEETIVTDIIRKISQEYQANIDHFSQDVIIAQLELLLTYSERFYQRQFITRRVGSQQILETLEGLLTACFDSTNISSEGIPTVEYVAGQLNLSPGYLSRMLRTLTGQSTRDFIHDRVIALAKEKLSATDLSVSEIAYQLGFGHPQSFSKLFKSKTQVSPIEFRASFKS